MMKRFAVAAVWNPHNCGEDSPMLAIVEGDDSKHAALKFLQSFSPESNWVFEPVRACGKVADMWNVASQPQGMEMDITVQVIE